MQFLTDFIFFTVIAATIICLFIRDPMFESILFIIFNETKAPDHLGWKLHLIHLIMYSLAAIPCTHLLTPICLIVVHSDLISRSLEYTCRLMKEFPKNTYRTDSRPWVNNMRNRRLVKVCTIFVEQTILNRITINLNSEIMPFYMIFVQPVPIPLIYICVRCYDQVSFFVYLPTVFTTFVMLFLLFVYHTVASSAFELSRKFLKTKKTVVPFWNRHSYWRVKFHSFRPIEWTVFWFAFRLDNLLPLFEVILNAIVSVLIF